MLKDAINRRLRLYFGVLFNMVFLDVLKLIFAVFVAFLFGKLVSKLKLPAILGWLLAGMTLGPHALGLLNEPMMEAAWYTTCLLYTSDIHDLSELFRAALYMNILNDPLLQHTSALKEYRLKGQQSI